MSSSARGAHTFSYSARALRAATCLGFPYPKRRVTPRNKVIAHGFRFRKGVSGEAVVFVGASEDSGRWLLGESGGGRVAYCLAELCSAATRRRDTAVWAARTRAGERSKDCASSWEVDMKQQSRVLC
jgi:hypothetical protein